MSQNYRDNYYGSILDPLHGDIKLSEIEKWCIAHPLFTRLRRIKQNTFLYYVFPSANHTRFEHSIGVMHVAGRIFDSCKENYVTGVKKMEKYGFPRGSKFFDLNELGADEEVFYQELRLAGLLHDIGHGPLSHLFDIFSISPSFFLEIVKAEAILSPYLSGFETLLQGGGDKVDHEIISCAFIFKIISELKAMTMNNPNKFSKSANLTINSLSGERIVKLIEPGFPGLKEFADSKEHNYTSFFSRIISAFPIDADRMDYLLRDSYFSGVTYGVYDINRIFASFVATKSGSRIDLAYKESGLDSMLRFIQSRSHLYNQVYFHKTNRAANTMLACGTTEGRRLKQKLLDTHTNLASIIDFYISNSDEYFLNKTVLEKLSKDALEKNIIDDLIQRKLFKRVFEIKIILTAGQDRQKQQIEVIKAKIDEKLEAFRHSGGIFAALDKFENDTFKDASRKAVLVARKTGKEYEFSDNWRKLGVEFSLADMNVLMIRIYLRRTFVSSAEYELSKDRILGLVQEEIDQLYAFAAR